MSSIPGLGRYPGEWNGNLLQYSCLENSMDRGAWWVRVNGETKELDTAEQLNDNINQSRWYIRSSCTSLYTHTHTHTHTRCVSILFVLYAGWAELNPLSHFYFFLYELLVPKCSQMFFFYSFFIFVLDFCLALMVIVGILYIWKSTICIYLNVQGTIHYRQSQNINKTIF